MDYYNFNIQSATSLNVGISDAVKFKVTYDGKHISGSAISTGSFGAGFFADTVGMGVAPGNSSYFLNIEAAQTYAARFKSRKTTTSTSQRTMIAVGSGQTKGAGIYFAGPSSTNFSIGVKEDNKFHIAPNKNDIGDASADSVTVDTSGNLEVNGNLTATGDIIAKNYIVSSSTTYMTTSFSAGSTAFGDSQDDTHQFTGSLNVTGSIVARPGDSDLTDNGALGLWVKGLNGGIKIGRHSGNDGAYTHLYTDISSTDFLYVKNNGGDGGGIATDKIAASTINPVNNYIHFDGYNKKFYGYNQGQKIYEQHDTDGISIMLPADDTFKVSGSLIQFTPTEKVSVTGNLELDGALTEASTMRIKTNIETLESPLDKISKLRGVSYNLKKNNEPSIGMIAEEVEEIFPELVSKDKDGKAAAMSYGRMTAVLLEAIKELKEEVDELKQENIYMKQMNRKNK